MIHSDGTSDDGDRPTDRYRRLRGSEGCLAHSQEGDVNAAAQVEVHHGARGDQGLDRGLRSTGSLMTGAGDLGCNDWSRGKLINYMSSILMV